MDTKTSINSQGQAQIVVSKVLYFPIPVPDRFLSRAFERAYGQMTNEDPFMYQTALRLGRENKPIYTLVIFKYFEHYQSFLPKTVTTKREVVTPPDELDDDRKELYEQLILRRNVSNDNSDYGKYDINWAQLSVDEEITELCTQTYSETKTIYDYPLLKINKNELSPQELADILNVDEKAIDSRGRIALKPDVCHYYAPPKCQNGSKIMAFIDWYIAFDDLMMIKRKFRKCRAIDTDEDKWPKISKTNITIPNKRYIKQRLDMEFELGEDGVRALAFQRDCIITDNKGKTHQIRWTYTT